jgi:CDP-glycerol glycerophosphotransferase (TagB/SpsB family)
MVLKHDGYVVWSEQARRELHRFYPYTREVPVYVVGAPQFDVFFQERFHLTRAAFCADFGLRPDRPIIVYALGSPNLFHEHHGALHLAQRIANGDLGDVQMIVRPHPIYDDAEMAGMFNKYAPRVVLQQTAAAGSGNQSQGMSQIMEWVNTFRHADVVVNLSSTVTIDAAIFDRPVVNLDYDPEPRQPQQEVIKDVNHVWDHFKPIAESGGVWLVNNHEEMVEAVRTYLAHPELHREKRRWIAEYVCGYVDGRCGERLAEAVLDFIHRSAQAQLRNGY